MDHVSCKPPTIPDGRISRVRFWPRLCTPLIGVGLPARCETAVLAHPSPRHRAVRATPSPRGPGRRESSSVSGCAWTVVATECPEPLCPTRALPRSGRPLPAAWKGVTPSSSLVRAHAPDHPPPRASGAVVREVFAGCRQPLLEDGPSRHYLCNPCVGAWTHTPPSPPGALTQFFPGSSGLAPREPRSADGIDPAMQLRQGAVFRGGSHSLRFKPPRSLGPQVAPTAVQRTGPPGRFHHASPGRLPGPGCGIASCPTWAIDTAGLSPAGLQPCRLLPPAHGSSGQSLAA